MARYRILRDYSVKAKADGEEEKYVTIARGEVVTETNRRNTEEPPQELLDMTWHDQDAGKVYSFECSAAGIGDVLKPINN